jgi:hypothetical protein
VTTHSCGRVFQLEAYAATPMTVEEQRSSDPLARRTAEILSK